MKTPLLLICTALALTPSCWAAKAHDHGVARLDVAVDPARVSFSLELPQDVLVGYERAPRSDAERDKAAAALARLRDGAALFRIDGSAGCTAAKVEISAPLLQQAPAADAGPGAGAKDGGHADVDGQFEFQCKAGARAGFVELGLFDAFPALKRIELQVVTPKGQMKATLVRPASRVMLVR